MCIKKFVCQEMSNARSDKIMQERYKFDTGLTHPDILNAEVCGDDDLEKIKIGECEYCESDLYDDEEIIESCDGMFCDMDCCCEYYEIRRRD